MESTSSKGLISKKVSFTKRTRKQHDFSARWPKPKPDMTSHPPNTWGRGYLGSDFGGPKDETIGVISEFQTSHGVGKLINLGPCYSDMTGSCQVLWALRVDVKRPQCLGRMKKNWCADNDKEKCKFYTSVVLWRVLRWSYGCGCCSCCW